MTQAKLPAVALFERGYTDLVSVIPPDASLSPESKISADQRGKAPGRRNRNGTWGGYDWRKHAVTHADARAWSVAGANIGLRAAHYPGLDIDTLDQGLADQIQSLALTVLGPSVVRYGRPPKRLLPYRTEVPFARMRLFVEKDGVVHLIEMLGDGQQYLVHGTHPVTRKPYWWEIQDFGDFGTRRTVVTLAEIDPTLIPFITVEQAGKFFDRASEVLAAQGYVVRREGDGRRSTRAAASGASLAAPSIEELATAVSYIPNTDDLFPGRDEYVKMGYAIRAAGGEDEEGAYTIFAGWAARHASDERVTGNPETWRGDWRRMRPPFSLGWDWIAGLARDHGYVGDAQSEFTTEGAPPDAPPSEDDATNVALSDRWLADRVVLLVRESLRYSPEMGRWYAWNGRRWEPDNLLRARDEIGEALGAVSRAFRDGAVGKSAKAIAERAARAIESTSTLDSVTKLVQARGEIAVRQESLDADPFLLNTPAGAVNLHSGEIALARPDQLATKLTAVGPDFGAKPERWLAFLAETTGGDVELAGYLQRLSGYALTGVTEEQVLVFIHGQGGNGKSVFLNVVRGVMGDYAKVAAMDAFTASKWDRHTTDLADLVGARLVTASETQADRAWDEQRVKQLSGGDPVKARFMRQDNFQFVPTFKLVFVGNHKPAIRDLDGAMRRRFHLVPFTRTPPVVDRGLGDKLRSEWPAILAWMIEGALLWRHLGLAPPATVREATEEYLADEDAIGRWLNERTSEVEGARTSAAKLYESWREWCGTTGEYAGSQRRLGQALGRRYKRIKGEGGITEYEGLTLKEVTWP
jgi:putative DNA primase/helicase